MLGDLVKRLVNLAVLFTALVAFFLVPIGRKTLSQHAIAIFTTPPARECASACADAARHMIERARAEVGSLRDRRLSAPAESEAELDPAD